MNKNPIIHHLYGLLFTLAAVFGFVFLTASSAEAIQCGVAQCSVDSQKRGVNTWSAPAPNNPSDPGDSDGGSNAPPKYTYAFTPCYRFLPSGGGQSVSSYPAPDVAGRYVCTFADGGSSSGGSGYTFFSCPPQGGKAANGRTTAYDAVTGEYAFFYCLYPTETSFNPVVNEGKVYTGGEGIFIRVLTAGMASQASNGGEVVDRTGYRSTGFIESNPRATPNLDQTFNAKTGTNSDGTPGYGFHRLQWELDYRYCTETIYPPLFNKPVENKCGPQQHEVTAEPYTYSCELSPALQPGANTTVSFKPSACAAEEWDCSVAADISINGALVGDVEVMRNGADIPTLHNNGQMPTLTGTAAKNPRAWRYQDMVLDKSSPTNNAKREFYSQYDAKGSKNKFGSWQPLTPAKQNMSSRFMWASDPVSTNSLGYWKMSREYKFTADFFVPTQAGIGSPTVVKPVMDDADCGSATSPNIYVKRSINSLTE